MTGEVIKSFLVGLGFGVDDASLSKFNKAISSSTLKVAALYAATATAATGIVAGISKISEGFEQMGYEYRLIIPAVNKAIQLRREMLKAYSAAGINIQRVVLSAVKLNFSLAKTKFAFEALYKSVASRYFERLTKASDIFRSKLYANLPKIQAVLERIVNFIFKALDAMTQLGLRLWQILGRVYDFFAELHKATDGWSTIILGMVAAWELLNLEFLATPLGLLLTGLLAILYLYDDFKVWQEGGESFFNWSSFIPIIDAVGDAINNVWKTLKSLGLVLEDVYTSFKKLFAGDLDGFLNDTISAAERLVAVFSSWWEVLKGIYFSLQAINTWGTGQVARAVNSLTGSNFQGYPSGAPLGAGGNSAYNSQTNQHLSQQTNIHIATTADATATAKAAAGEQGRINFDLARNFAPAAK